jgi:NADPH2:quinone reductase
MDEFLNDCACVCYYDDRMKTRMQSYWVLPRSGTTLLELREAEVPQPGPGQLLLRVRAAGLNRGEMIAGHGGHAKEGAAGRPAGVEGAGEVAQIGAGVQDFREGDRVMGRCRGSFSEFVVMDVREAVRVPQGLTWQEAGSIPLVFTVVHDMLIAQGRLQAGEWLLVVGVSSGVGVASLQTAKALGAKVIGTSGSEYKLERLKSAGLDVGVRTRSADFAAAVLEATGGTGVNLAVNNVGGSVFAECVRTLAFEGRFATIGHIDGVNRSEMDVQSLHAKRLTLFGVSNSLRNADQRATAVPGFKADILPFIESGRIRPLIDRVFSFGELAAAKAYMESNAHVGKIAVVMDA